MSYSLSILQNGRAASVIVSLTENVSQNFTFAFDIAMTVQDVRSNGIDLLTNAEVSNTSDLSNFSYTAASSGTFIGPLTAGTRLLSFEFEVLEAGIIDVTSFEGSFDGVVQPTPALPEIDLEAPPPLEADMILGDFAVGETLSVDTSQLPNFGLLSEQSLEYTWFRDGTITQIGEAEAATYVLTDADDGAVISLRVAYIDGDFIERIVFSSDEERVGDGPDENRATSGDDSLSGVTDEQEVIEGGNGNDSIFGGPGVDFINGDDGIDTAVFSGPQNGYTLQLSPTSARVDDRTAGRDDYDLLTGIEFLKFEGETAIPAFFLDRFDSGAQLTEAQFNEVIELYIAYYNRAPDSLGLAFWTNAYAEGGVTLGDMANDFATQPETQGLYPEGTTDTVFIEAVYNNVLGRDPDAPGLAFWLGQLGAGGSTRAEFILDILQGTRAPLPDGTPQETIDQQALDRVYLETKTDVGAYFAVHLGMTDAENAQDVMDAFGDATQADEAGARTVADGFVSAANDPLTGEFLIQITGVLTDDFSGGIV
ncbi:DUF4214 domain-containing protein [Marivita sp. S6314]|uniref:DUF4214 domain-containing protein n=1 Tax=Marivita sp. S6314 TaxID=2926406 RepID=UPI001FF334C2|nr:DUF4214 domain-containing protein [Marivita sp. S6314]MCK0151433.1 DUF4214 domain-containing protein [Marivita sp. S6314]